MKPIRHHHGKQRLRVRKVLRHAARRAVKERECAVPPEADFAARFPAGDHGPLLPPEEPHGQIEATFTRA